MNPLPYSSRLACLPGRISPRLIRLFSSSLAACAVGVVALSAAVQAAPFTNGNIAVLQADASANNTTASIIELTPATASQTPTNVIALDGTTAAVAMRFSGSASSTGYMANSADGSLLAFTGANNTSTSANANTLNPRAVGTFNNAGSFSLATTYTGTSGSQTRCATSLNNSNWFIAEQGGLYTNGATAASPAGNFRGSKTFGGQVYLSQSSATATQIGTVSAITGGTLTGLPGLTFNASIQDFYLISSGSNGSSFDVLYVLSATSNTAGTISKYSLVAGTWTANGTTYTTTFGGFGLAAQQSGPGATLFVSTGLGALAANNVLRITDTAGFNGALNIVTTDNVTLYTAATGKIVKGVAFAPTAAAAANYTLTYNAGANGSISGTNPQTVVAGASGTAVTAVPNTGYHFTQWSDTSTANPRTDTNVTANLSVSASFVTNSFTLTYSDNGSTSGTAPVDASSPYNNNSTVTVLDNTGSLLKTGYAFGGWNTAADGSGTGYNAGSTFSITANTTLYAKWLGGLPSIVITEVAPWSSSYSPVAADWFELTNTGSTPVNVTGWKMDDNSNNFALAAGLIGVTTIAPGESVVFIETTSSTTVDTFKSTWFGSNPPASLQIGTYSGSGVGLSSTADAVNIFDASGNRVTGVAFGASPSAAPFATLDNKAGLGSSTLPLPVISTVSIAGTNGAFVAASDSNETGSPGTTSTQVGADLTVSIVAPSVGSLGVNFDFTITALNSGNVDATGVAVNFTLPAGLTFISATGASGFSGVNNTGVVNFAGGSLTAGSSAILTVTVSTTTAATYAAAIGSVVIDPANTVAEYNETNNSNPTATSTAVTGPIAPNITTQPASQNIATGTSATLSVVAAGSPLPTFQWYLGASPDTTNLISGATSASYTTPVLLATASYWVRATNSQGSADSNTAVITVTYAPAYGSSGTNPTNILKPDTGAWNPAGVNVNGTQFINLGLQGVGRIPAALTDTTANANGHTTANTGESLGSVSDMQITGWKKNTDGSFSGTFNTLPDRGYNNGTTYSNYAARINKFDFNFTPYTGTAALPATTHQIAVEFTGSERFTYDRGGDTPTFTTGLLADHITTIFGSTPAPATGVNTTQSDGTVTNRLTLDSEGFVLDKRAGKSGAGWVSDEYGPYIYHFNSSKQFDGQLQLPAALLPHAPVGTLNFVDTNVNGRRANNGLEGLSQSPSGTRLFALMQNATLQDASSGSQGRFNTRLLAYDVSTSNTPNAPAAQYVIQLPRIDSTGSGASPDRTGAQSCMLALNDHQVLILSRDGNGRGSSGSPIFKSIILADLSTGTNIDGLYDAEGAAVAPGGVIAAGVTPISWTEALNMIGKLNATSAEVAKFGLNLNAGPGDINTICEKWEALALVSANDAANPNDYFLFISNDNDFLSGSGKYMAPDGTIASYDSGLENDTLFLAWRVRMTGPDNQAPIITNTIPDQSAVTGAAFNYQFPTTVFSDPENGILTYSATGTNDTALPAWLLFNPATRTFTGSPATADIGSLAVKVTATDNGTPNLSASTSFTISISPLTFLGVAAGDADSNSATLWTRTNEGVTANIDAQVATDLAFTAPVSFGTVTDPTKDFTAKVTATGLASGTKFYYRFVASGSSETSGTGTFKTAPAANASSPLHFAFSGDNDGLMRPYALANVIPSQNLDFYVNLGDVIYENASNLTTSGAHNGAPWLNSPAVTLSNDSLSYNGIPRSIPSSGAPFATQAQLKAEYTKKYRENFLPVNAGGQNSLQVLYAAQGNYTTYDNHELGNRKYIDGGSPAGGSVGGAAGTDMTTGRGVDARNGTGNANDVNTSSTDIMNRSTGFQTLRDVFINYQPIADRGTISAPADPRTDGSKRLYSAQQWGMNATYINTDARSYRDIRLKTATANADDTSSPRADNPNRTYLGATQLAWLKQTLLAAQNNGTTWKFVSLSDPIDQLGPIGGALAGTLTSVNSDGGKAYMGGYRSERNDLLKFIADNHIANVVFLATDDHQNRINELSYSTTGQTAVQSSYMKVPFCFSIVCGPLGATGPDSITDHSFGNIKAIADSLANAQTAASIDPVGLENYPGLHNLFRENDPTASSSPQPVDFYSPDTFNFTTLDVSADGKTLSVTSTGMNSTAQNAGTEYSAGPQARTVFSFQIDAPTELQTWRAANFGTTSTAGNLADVADFDGDGIANLVEYALAIDPTSGTGANGPSALPIPLRNDGDPLLTDRLALSFVMPDPTPADITYRVQAGNDLGTWIDVALKTGTSPWSWLGGGSSHIVTSGSGPVSVKIGDSVPRAGNPTRLMRLKITTP